MLTFHGYSSQCRFTALPENARVDVWECTLRNVVQSVAWSQRLLDHLPLVLVAVVNEWTTLSGFGRGVIVKKKAHGI